MIVAEKIRLLVAGCPFCDQGQSWPATVSIGVASLLAHQPTSAAGLLQQADQALYRAKRAGRNRIVAL